MAKNKKIIFRADGNAEIGLGHVTRSLALAEMLKDDFYCIFATRFLTDFLTGEIKKVCPELIHLPESDAHADKFISLLNGNEIVVLDNYFFDTIYQAKIKDKGCKLVCIDDLHDKHFVSDIIINHAPGAENINYSVENYTIRLLGLQYALLRSPFRKEINQPPTLLANKPDNIFVCFGGADYLNLTEKTIDCLISLPSIEKIYAVVGNANSKKHSIRKKYEKHESIIVLANQSAEEMVSIIKKTNLAIVPASSVLLELFAIGKPVITGFYVDNQQEAFHYTIKEKLALGVDMNSSSFEQKLYSILSEKTDKEIYNQMILRQKKHIKDAQPSLIHLFNQLN